MFGRPQGLKTLRKLSNSQKIKLINSPSKLRKIRDIVQPLGTLSLETWNFEITLENFQKLKKKLSIKLKFFLCFNMGNI